MEPEFQRDYVWTQDQKVRYVEFLLRGGNTGRDILFNCPYWNSGKPNLSDRMVIVDGKQRLSAVIGFLNNEVTAFNHYYYEFTDNLRNTLVNLTFHINELGTRAEILM